MISYRDMTFCKQKCGNMECHRNFTDEVSLAADLWWGDETGGGPPIAMADFKSNKCGYVPPKELLCHIKTHGQGIQLPSPPLSEYSNVSLRLKTGRRTTRRDST